MSSGGMTRDANLMKAKEGVSQDSLQRCLSLPALPPAFLPSLPFFLKILQFCRVRTVSTFASASSALILQENHLEKGTGPWHDLEILL